MIRHLIGYVLPIRIALRHNGDMISMSKSQISTLDESAELAFSLRLADYLKRECPSKTADAPLLIAQARAEELVTEREIAMFALFRTETGESPIHEELCLPRQDEESSAEYRLRFDLGMERWMSLEGFAPV